VPLLLTIGTTHRLALGVQSGIIDFVGCRTVGTADNHGHQYVLKYRHL
jgi:hypothetical protein